MATFYVAPYTVYHNSLRSASGMVSSASALKDKASYLTSTVSTLASQVNSAYWIEQGHEELVNTTLPALSTFITSLSDNITSLAEAVNIAVNELLPAVTDLEINDKEYERVLKELNSLVEPPRTISSYVDGKHEEVENPAYAEYVKKKAELEKQLRQLEQLCRSLQQTADSCANRINALGSGIDANVSAMIPPMSTGVTNSPGSLFYGLSTAMEISRTPQLINYGEYYVVNTPYSVIEYYNHVQEKGLYQDATKDYRNKCKGVSNMYLRDLLLGTSRNSMESAYSGAETWATHTNSETEQEALAIAYEELKAGRPVCLNVKGSDYRHWVVAVGFKTDVKNAADLKAEDLLIMDVWDGEIERMDHEKSRIFLPGYECGHNYDWRVDVLRPERYGDLPNSGTAVA